MRLKGYFTLEATYIFTAVTLLVVGLIRLDFYLHDSLVNDVAKILGGIRYYQVSSTYYDMEKECIDREKTANTPVIGIDYDFNYEVMTQINNNVSIYYNEKIIGTDVELTDTRLDEVILPHNNAEVVRSAGRAVQVVGGIFDES